jgi:glutathione S-transferase
MRNVTTASRAARVAEGPILYSFRRCPYAMRARLALLVSRSEVVIREVALRAKPPELLAVSAKATVPVLVLPDGVVIDESLDIMHWALHRHDPEGWLGSPDAALIAANDGAFKVHLDRYKYASRLGDDLVFHRQAAVDWLAELEARLAGCHYLGGATPSLADAAIMPFVRQFALVDPTWFEVQPLPRLQTWLAGQLASPLFNQAMVRLLPWRAGAPDVYLRGSA